MDLDTCSLSTAHRQNKTEGRNIAAVFKGAGTEAVVHTHTDVQALANRQIDTGRQTNMQTDRQAQRGTLQAKSSSMQMQITAGLPERAGHPPCESETHIAHLGATAVPIWTRLSGGNFHGSCSSSFICSFSTGYSVSHQS